MKLLLIYAEENWPDRDNDLGIPHLTYLPTLWYNKEGESPCPISGNFPKARIYR